MAAGTMPSSGIPETARFALRGHDLPRLAQALSFAEWFRQALMSASQREGGGVHAASLFSGKDADGERLLGPHRHAFVLPDDDDGDGRIDHVTVYAPEGFDGVARQALQQVQVLYRGHQRPEIWCVLLGAGPVRDLAGTLAATPTAVAARHWRSLTPYMLTRHVKGPGRDDAPAQLRRDLARRGWPEPALIRPVPGTPLSQGFLPWEQFERFRRNRHGSLGHTRGFGFRLQFAEPVDPADLGLPAFGYACHFGLGRFVPESGE